MKIFLLGAFAVTLWTININTLVSERQLQKLKDQEVLQADRLQEILIKREQARENQIDHQAEEIQRLKEQNEQLKFRRLRRTITDDVWWKLRMCESSDGRTSSNGLYFGYFQFALSTWRGLGETGYPMDYSYEYQREVAKRLQARSGWGQWPACSKRLGLA